MARHHSLKVHQARVRGEFRVVGNVEVKIVTKSGSSALDQVGDGGNILSVAVIVLLQGRGDSDLGGEVLDVVTNVEVGAPELLAGDEGGLVGIVHLFLENLHARRLSTNKEHCLCSTSSRLLAGDAGLAVKCQDKMVWRPEAGPDLALMSRRGLSISPGERTVMKASRRAAKV